MGVRIITDSTSDISLDQAKKLGITIVPLKVIFGDKEYKEGIEITMDKFYEMLGKAEKLPTTSQPAPDEFLVHFNQAKEAGDSVVVIVISSKLSGTYQSACIAKEMSGHSQIYIVDSMNAITGLRLLVDHAIKLKDQGISAEQIADTLEKLKDRIVLLAAVDTLEYLHKGGRLSKSSAILGTLLKFKPIINVKDGVVGVVGKERGTNKAIARTMELIEEFGSIDTSLPVYFGYTADDAKSIILRENVVEKYSLKDESLFPVGCVVGTHVGPGACVITYFKK